MGISVYHPLAETQTLTIRQLAKADTVSEFSLHLQAQRVFALGLFFQPSHFHAGQMESCFPVMQLLGKINICKR